MRKLLALVDNLVLPTSICIYNIQCLMYVHQGQGAHHACKVFVLRMLGLCVLGGLFFTGLTKDENPKHLEILVSEENPMSGLEG